MLSYTNIGNAPLSLAEAKEWLRIEHTYDDSVISALIESASDYAQQRIGDKMLLRNHTVIEFRSQFCPKMLIEVGPVSGVTVVAYRNAMGDWITVPTTTYYYEVVGSCCTISLYTGSTWPTPSALWQYGVRLEYTAGMDAQNVPANIKTAMRLLIAFWYENREDISINETNNPRIRSANTLLDTYRTIY